MDSSVWRTSSHLPEGIPHVFLTAESKVSLCGREEHIGNKWSEPLEGAPTAKCKTCVYILEGSFTIARIKAQGGGILHR
jgi:hypothetical protein